MTAYSADARTARQWRHCLHQIEKGRCIYCRAKEVGDYTQLAHPTTGGTPLGSLYLEPQIKKEAA